VAVIRAYRWQPVDKPFRVSELGVHFALDMRLISHVVDRHEQTEGMVDDQGYLYECDLDVDRMVETMDTPDWDFVRNTAANLADFQSEAFFRREDFFNWTASYRENLMIDTLSPEEIHHVRQFAEKKRHSPSDFRRMMAMMEIDTLLYWNVYEAVRVPHDMNLFSVVVFDVGRIFVRDAGIWL